MPDEWAADAVVEYQGVRLEILWGPIGGGARYPGKIRYWARRLDNDQEGYVILDAVPE